jgi:hypothetical protein
MQGRIWQFLDLNAGRIRYDYIERLQSSMTQFERDLTTGVTMLTESLRSALHRSGGNTQQGTDVLEELDGAVRVCSELMS